MSHIDIAWREEVVPSDRVLVRSLCRSSGFFQAEEIEVAEELVRERLDKGPASGYFFIFAETIQTTLGYACYGPVAGTRFSWDVYWLAVDNVCRGQGVGKRLMKQVEARIVRQGGQRMYVETSAREQYHPTRSFYAAIGYQQVAFLEDYYAPADGKVILLKTVSPITG